MSCCLGSSHSLLRRIKKRHFDTHAAQGVGGHRPPTLCSVYTPIDNVNLTVRGSPTKAVEPDLVPLPSMLPGISEAQ